MRATWAQAFTVEELQAFIDFADDLEGDSAYIPAMDFPWTSRGRDRRNHADRGPVRPAAAILAPACRARQYPAHAAAIPCGALASP